MSWDNRRPGCCTSARLYVTNDRSMDRKVKAIAANDDRFDFGGNWLRFLPMVTEQRIAAAESSLREMLELGTLAG